MTDAVKFIFKPLIKVPIYIAISYLIFNIVFMCLFYFKFLGISYTVMQTCMENNFLADREKNAIQSGLDEIVNRSAIISDAYVAVYDTSRRSSTGAYIANKPNASNNRRTQYGSTKTVGIHYVYTWIWPLTVQETGLNIQSINSAEDISNNNTNSNMHSDSTLESAREAKKQGLEFDIYYTVPGLQYYADLD
jgi:uncharacterized membrane-anchored protein YitT (DUF2179 family)